MWLPARILNQALSKFAIGEQTARNRAGANRIECTLNQRYTIGFDFQRDSAAKAISRP